MTEGNEQLVAALRASVRENERLKQADNEPVAIVSMSCRCPGGVSSPEELWDLVAAERDAVGPLPGDRGWDLDRLYHPDPDHQGTCYVTEGGFLDGAGRFDPGFFGIAPREAEAMDPQQRLLLETSWELFERAGVLPQTLRGSSTGVFLGAAWQGYGEGWRDLPDGLQGHLVTGMSTSVISGRLAYTLGLEGPAITLDTGCSSSFVALHLAMQSLRRRECALAVVGGAAVMSAPISLVGFSRHRALARDGRCKAFSADADGMGLGEGAGTLLLERLSDARRNGHPVLAVVAGSAINQDGASNGMAAPNGVAQQRVIRQALANARLEPADVDTVEAHGTGTSLGDPIEAEALLATYGRDRSPERPLWIGSLKSNIGHAQAAAGVLSIIKTVQAARHGVYPRTLHADEPSPNVDWSDGVVAPLREARPWPRAGAPRTAGISSFGVSGTNAHVILREAPPEEATEEAADRPAARPAALPLVLSARTGDALRRQAAELRTRLADDPDPLDVAYTLATARTAFEHRAAVVGTGTADLRAGLAAVAGGAADGEVVRGTVRRGLDRRVVFMFPGQGSQWAGMAGRLVAESAEFAERMAECDRALAPFTGWSLLELLEDEDTAWMERVDRVQPVLFAVMVSLAAMWRAAGVEPDAVIGHSQGEIAAACVAGALSLDDAARVVALRSRALTRIAGGGGMMSVALPPERVRSLLERRSALSLAAANGAASTVVSGPAEELADLARELEEDGTRTRRVPVDYASHSADVELLHDELLDALAPVAHHDGEIPFYSTVTADRLRLSAVGPEYWYRNLRRPVELEHVTRLLADHRHDVFLEVSPHPVLTPAISETLADQGRLDSAVVVGTLRRDEGGLDRFLRSACELHVSGVAVGWDRLLPGGRTVDLPTYPFERGRYWLDAPAPGAAAPSETDTWRYQVAWRPADSGTEAPALRGDWLVAVPAGRGGAPLVEDVLEALRTHGARPVPVELDAAHDDRASIAERLRACGAPAGALSLLALADEPVAASGRSTGTTLNTALVQALGDTGGQVPLWTATSGAVAVRPGDTLTAPDQAAAWGMGRIAAVEHPHFWAGLVDLPERLAAPAASRLAAVLAGAAGEPQVAVRASGTYARRLVPASPAAQRWTPAGTVLVTGGTGALGGHVARWLARNGAEHIVLTGRRGPRAPGAEELRAELAELGAEATVAACDAADPDALAELLETLPSLDAVVHAAGVLDDGLLDGLTGERCDAVFAPKVAAARNLHELTRDRDLSAFVLFSSFAGTLGGPGQGAYAAANAYLDALARHRRDHGLPATAIAWGAWDGGGLVDEETAARLRSTGMPAMPPDRAVEAMGRAVGSGDTAVAVADVDWALLTASSPLTGDSPVVSEIPAVKERRAPARQADGDDGGRWTRLHGEERERALTDLVVGEVAAALGHDAATLATDRAFRELGFDSLTAVDLRNRLAAATGLTLPVTLVFDYPTADELIRHLSEALPGGSGEAVEEAAAAPPAATAAAAEEPIAIVAMSCRLPGGVSTPEDLWRLLDAGGDAVGPFPRDRGWDVDGLYDADPDTPGTYYVQGGGFLRGAADFDAAFFGISPREALTTDPQQRLLLETAWEAFERAGIDPRTLKGSPTGVYVGASYNDYGARVSQPSEHEGYLALGSASSVASGRISYMFGFEGPALTVDTACSSSLVALHLAVQALRRGECTLALAGGVVVMSSMDTFVEWSRQRAMAPDGRCKAFSADADGAGWAEGVGLVLLEPLSQARRRGHRVLGLVRGSAVNQDGASNGLTAPNGPSQQRVVRAALEDAGLGPDDIDAVEAHGTGTSLGDPIEAQALAQVYGENGRERPLRLGSLKSNIGHTQAASGIAGVIKMTLALQHERLPKTLHAERPSPHIDWESGPLAVLTESAPWQRNGRSRRSGVSSFGVSGTNAHVVLEEAPVFEGGPAGSAEPGGEVPVVPWVVSGRGVSGLRGQAERLARFGREAPGVDVGAVAAGLAGRSGFEERAVVLGSDAEEVSAGLDAVAAGAAPVRGAVGRARAGRVGVVFSGQGAQRLGMGRELHGRFSVFAEVFDAAVAELEGHLGSGVRDVVWGEDARVLERTVFAQAGLFAVEVALFRLLESWGVEPGCVMGHSVGELAAAHVAGVWSLADAARVVAARGRLMEELPEGGAMLSVDAGEERVAGVVHAVAEAGGRVDVAAVNGPHSAVVSGAESAVDEVERILGDDGHRVRRLRVSRGFHSALMEPMLDDFRRVLEEVEFSPPRLGVVSNVSGGVAESDELCSPEYWVRHVRQTVRFADGVGAMAEAGVSRFVEVGPDGSLVSQVQACLDSDDAVLVAALRRGRGEVEAVLGAVADLWVDGTPVDWREVVGALDAHSAERAARIELPTYAFQRQRFWLEAGGSDAEARNRHGLVDRAVELADGRGVVWTGRVSVASHPWLADHAVGGRVWVPGTALLELGLHAALGTGCGGVEELTLQQPLVLPPRGEVELQVVVEQGERPGIAVYSRSAADEQAAWRCHAEGTLATDAGSPPTSAGVPETAEELSAEGLYDRLAEGGFGYGPAFQGLQRVWTDASTGDGAVFAEAALPDPVREQAQEFVLHPALLDAALHALAFAELEGLDGGLLPFSWSGVRVYAAGAATVRVRIVPLGGGGVGLLATDAAGSAVAEVERLWLRPAGTAGSAAAASALPLYRPDWQAVDVGWAGSARPAVLEAGAGAESLRDLPDPVPELVAIPHKPWTGELAAAPEAARQATGWALALVQAWLADERFADARLAFVATGPPADDDIVTAAVWGLVRSAQNEYPDRFVLAVADDAGSAAESLLAARGEAELRVEDDTVRARRLVPAPPDDSAVLPDTDGTVLITGATGGLGALIARHLAEHHGVRSLVLTGRRGAEAPGMPELRAELAALGARVTVAACDTTDPGAVAEVVGGIPADLPLKAVVHAAGVLDDGVVSGLTPERIATVLRPKIDGAVTVWEQVRHLDPAAFVLFSSVSGTLGGAGQGAYAAANAALDALATRLRGEGAPVTSMAWGLWAQSSGMTEKLGEADLRRVARSGVEPMESAEALALFDAALRTAEPVVAPVRLDTAALRRAAQDGLLPPVLSALAPGTGERRGAVPALVADVPAPAAPVAGPAESLADRLAALPETESRNTVRELVRGTAAAVLGYAGAEAIDSEQGLLDAGFDSLTAVELRNRLNKATGLRLPVTLLFDYPTAAAIGEYLCGELLPDPEARARAELDELEQRIRGFAENGAGRDRLARLRAVLDSVQENGGGAEEGATATRIESASDDEMFAFIDQELGISDE
ncbi:type I polyketide synthase [Streptomonospora litoralis]|uniref:Erythronolide synthase, modules 3 and 4 n=1 Tax=Streptomonospora litoralis TaxID=2498135 RepID=A0A4P6Q662_9ACTN|nr:type I polyketide synthase [Streptomonospora litoralis]QBI54871.1 Erythronolide synthase, modules 3 and 4 [Streptomonospora litoralis]